MSTWTFTLTPGGDITDLVDLPTLSRELRLYTELKPNTNTCRFKAAATSGLLATLVTNDEVECVITKDAAPYFAGVISPNHKATIKQGQRYVDIIVEDYSLSRLGKTITDTIVLASYDVSAIADYLATLAGVTIAAGAPSLTTVVPYFLVMPDEKATYASLLSDLLFEFNHVYGFNESGEMTITMAVNPGTITPAELLNATIDGGVLRGELEIKKAREKYDDIRVNYKSIEAKSGIVLFQDTTGGSGSQEAAIEVAPGAYYPKGADIGEVFSNWGSPEGYEIHIATSAALDASIPAGMAMPQPLTNYYRRASFAYQNPTGSALTITKLKIVGNAYVVTAENVARSSVSSGIALLEYKAKYIYDVASAQNLARALCQYYRASGFTYVARTKVIMDVGTYARITDSVFSGVDQKCRVVGRTDKPYTDVIEYQLESVDDFATTALIHEATALPVFTNLQDQLLFIANDGLVSPQEKSAIKNAWGMINGDGINSGSYWATRQDAHSVGVSTSALDSARDALAQMLLVNPGVINPVTWEKNIGVDQSFYTLWSDYYQAEASTIGTIAYFASFGSIQLLDCGDYNGSTDDGDDVVNGGEYIISNDEDTSVDYDFGDWSAVAEDSELDLGAWLPGTEDELIDLGVYKIPDLVFISPQLIVDCGSFDS